VTSTHDAEDRQRRTTLLRNALAVCAGIATLHLIVTTIATDRPAAWFVLLVGCILSFLGLRAATRERTVDRVAVAFLAVTIVAIAAGAVADPGTLPYLVCAAIVVIVLAGGLVGPTAAIMVGAVFVALEVFMIGAAWAGWLPGDVSLSKNAILVLETLTASGMVAVLVGDRARAIEALKAERQRLDEMVTQTPDVLLSYDGDGTILDVSPAARTVLGQDPDALRGSRLQDTSLAALSSLQPGAEPVEIPVPRKHGDDAIVEVNARHGHASDGRPVVRATLRDVSSRLRERDARASLTEQLHHAQRLDGLGRLAGGVAHDFNNLLTVILGNAAILRGTASDQDEPLVSEIQEASERASQLTRQLLQFSRRDRPHPTVLDASRAAEELCPLLARMLGEQVQLDVKGQPECHVRIDRGRLEQVLINLVLNARDAMPEGGRVTLSVSAPSDTLVELRVSDEGPGITPDAMARAFEPFFTTKAPGEGTGLGLSVVHGIVHSVDGQVEITAPASGGTCVAIRLPRVAKDHRTPAPAPRSERDAPLRILVIEDEGVVLATVRRVLRLAGHSVEAAIDGEAAEAALRRGPVDLVLSDVILPGDTGPAIVGRLEAQFGPQKVLYMSGYPADALDMPGSSGPRLLPKPFTPDDLLDAVRTSTQPKPQHR